jgi:2-dehydro-3-deoxyphosphogluconate aldolase/(4S)-4-hydroxy-2-oxoglutarate aldolase
MTKDAVVGRMIEVGIVPVLRAQSAGEAIAVADAIAAGGIDVLEITMTVPGAVLVIAEVVRRYGDRVLVGAGTVLDAKAAGECLAAGARFIVAPIIDDTTIALCRRENVAVLPGALTPTEVVRAWRAGADLVKVFPCSAVGGASYIKALKAPLPQIPLVPTGGVTVATAGAYFAAGASAIGVGSDLCNVAAIREGRPDRITDAARAYLEAVQAARAVV